MASSSSKRGNSTSGCRYESFEDAIEYDYDDYPTPSISSVHNTRSTTALVSDIELMGNGVMGSGNTNYLHPNVAMPSTGSSFSTTPHLQPKRVRLRAVESEREYFLKQMDTDLFRKLIIVQIVASLLIIIAQVILYAVGTRLTYRYLDVVGIGIWGPMIFFITASWLTWITTRTPSGCSIGIAMGFQISSIIVGMVLLFFAAVALFEHGMNSYYWRTTEVVYEPEVTGRTMCSLIILASICETVTALFISIQFCRVTCCARSDAHEAIMFDIETTS